MTKKHILKTKINDKIIDIKFNKECQTKEEALCIMLIKYIKHIETRRKNNTSNYQKHQNNDDTKQRRQHTKALWYQNNKEHLRQKQLTNYHNDPDYKQRLNDKNKRAYDKKMMVLSDRNEDESH